MTVDAEQVIVRMPKRPLRALCVAGSGRRALLAESGVHSSFIHSLFTLRTRGMSRYEQPTYTVVESRPGYEIRLYESYLVAETTVPGDFGSSGNVAFRRLAGFIFGRNSQYLRMNMTVPVTHQPTEDGAHRYRFVMERAYSEQTLPRPLDSTISLVRLPSGLCAARSYRGGRSESRFRRIEAELVTALKRDGLVVTDDAAVAVYNGPATPPPLRRNEVLIPIAWPQERAA